MKQGELLCKKDAMTPAPHRCVFLLPGWFAVQGVGSAQLVLRSVASSYLSTAGQRAFEMQEAIKALWRKETTKNKTGATTHLESGGVCGLKGACSAQSVPATAHQDDVSVSNGVLLACRLHEFACSGGSDCSARHAAPGGGVTFPH